MDYLVCQYPMTQMYMDRVAKLTGGPVTQVVVSTITAKGYMEVFKCFRQLKSDTLYLPLLDPAGSPLLPPLQVLSMLTRSHRRVVVNPDFTTTPFGIADAGLGALQMAWGMVHGAVSVLRTWLSLRRLLNAPRIPVPAEITDDVIYLKTNLWLGVQAGGAVAHTSGVINGLLKKGYGVNFVSVEEPVALPDHPLLKIVAVKPRQAYVVPREFNHYRHNETFTKEATRQLSPSAGFIYQRMSLGNFAGVVLSRRNRVPLILEYNGSENWLAKNWGTPLTMVDLATMTETVCLRHAHLLVTVSEELRDELVERGVDPARVVVHSNGVDPTVFDPGRFSEKQIADLRKGYGIERDAIVVTFVGTFGPWHGAEIFARTVSDLASEMSPVLKDRKLHFMFIGDGVRRPIVEELTSGPGVRDFVTITGLIDQVDTPIHLAASDILVSPHVRNPDGSPFFGSPTKLFEYLASGRPVVGSDLNQIGDILKDCPLISDLEPGSPPPEIACGIRVKPESTSDLGRAIMFLAENPDWRRAAGRNARRRSLERYTWDRHVDAILDGFVRARALDAPTPERPIRLLFNALHSKSGGGVTYLQNVLPLMAKRKDFDVHICIHEDQKVLLPGGLRNVTVHLMDFPPGFWQLQVREQTDVPALARKIGADVTFSPANFGPLRVANSVILLRNALSVAFVERRPVKLLYWLLVYVVTLLSLLVSKRAITVSEYARHAAAGGLMGLFSDRLTVVPHGVSEIFVPLENERKRDSFLLAVSDIYVQKNLKNLVRALALLKPKHPDVLLKIAGNPVDQVYFRELMDEVTGHDLDQNVEFLGGIPSSELTSLYQKCGVFVFPSTVETFGNPLVEAMACGAPIASSNSAAMPEVVGDAAEFFDPGNVENIASVIDRLLGDADLRRDLSRRAVERATDFSWHRTAEQTLQVIKQAAQGGDGD